MSSATRVLLAALCAAAPAAGAHSARWVSYEGAQGPGTGKRILLISGDEEYRSEESLPMLGRILARRHGFSCSVLFSQDASTGEIDPDEQTNIPGMQLLDRADLLILALRFRELPDEDMEHLVDYLAAGKPFIALRTSTHAFRYTRHPDSPWARFSFDSREWPGGFGAQLLGETWWRHHGDHGKESTRGLIDGENMGHPVLKGVRDVWGDTDVYGVRELPDEATVLLHGLSLSGMRADSPPSYDKPIMPIVWLKQYRVPGGQTGTALTSTIGAATDFRSRDLRRLIVNAAYYLTGLEDAIDGQADVDYVGEYEPSAFGFGGYRRGVTAADHELRD